MTLQYCSDLHLEFPENKKFLYDNPLQQKGDVLLLAGDVVPFALMDRYSYFVDYISDHFETTYWIPGNHEYYHGDASVRSGILDEHIRSNVHLVNNKVVQLEGIKLIFTTLWTHISPARQWAIERGMNDFRVIKYGDKAFTAREYNLLHHDSLSFLNDSLSEPGSDTTVVVTHHVPTGLHYPEKYKGSPLNEAFAVELYSLIEELGPEVWIYGHHHFNVPDFQIGKTALTTNQVGYVRFGEHEGFDSSKCLPCG